MKMRNLRVTAVALLLAASSALLSSCAQEAAVAEIGDSAAFLPVDAGLPDDPEESAEPEPSMESPPEPEHTVATLCVAGDIVLHTPLTDDSYVAETGGYDYTHIFEQVRPYLEAADYAVACMETTFNSQYGYSGYPQFNSPPGLATSLSEVGIDLLSTASNHCMDTYVSGLVETLDVLDAAGIAHVGTYRSQEERDENSGMYIADVGGISVAFLAYTYGTNGLPVTGYEYAANIFTVDYMTNLSVVDYDLISSDMEAARNSGADVIAVFMHWGNEYSTTPSPQQEEIANFLFAEGAGLILGGHTHVPQPMEIREIENSDGATREGYICYCLGNFISNQKDKYTNLTALVNIELTKNERTGEVVISACEYVPCYMLNRGNSLGGRYLLLDISRAVAEYEAGESRTVSEDTYRQLLAGLDDLHAICGPETLK